MSNLHREECNHLLEWEKIEADTAGGKHTYRCPVPGGWLIRFITTHPADISHIFLSDPNHLWGVPNTFSHEVAEEAGLAVAIEQPDEVLVYDETPELTEGDHQNPAMEKRRRR